MTDPDWTGRELLVEVGPVAHGGHCVARHEGRVVFVRHALPGEHVAARVTEDRGGAYCRADAVRILQASPDRVEPPCPHSRPGGCGGCDWQHASPQAQLELKAAVVCEQLERLGGRTDLPVTVEASAGGPLGWRTRVRFAVTADGTVGLHRHRSHDVEPVLHCPLATPEVDGLGVPAHRWAGASAVEAVVSSAGDRALVVTARPAADVAVPATATLDGAAVLSQAGRGRRAVRVRGHRAVREKALGRVFRVGAAGFWQVHPAAAETLTAAVIAALRPQPGESVLDLYAGAGLFAAALAPLVGGGRVVAVESDREAATDAGFNLRDLPVAATVEVGQVGRVLQRLSGGFDLVVLDPPRSGAGAGVVAQIAALRPRAVAYVACDPASFARDVAAFAGHRLRLTGVRAFDLFPMTHHVECVGLLEPVAGG